MISISKEESIVLSYIRISAVAMIVLCHFFQAYDNRWAYIFNVGVQIFLILSGFLYGHKNISNWKDWSKKRAMKLYLPVFVFLTLALPLYLFFYPSYFNLWGYLCNYFNVQGIPFVMGGVQLVKGTRHLWFLTAIMMAYCFTPILQIGRKKASLLFTILWMIQMLAYYILPGPFAFILSWFTMYGIGYMFANMSPKHRDYSLCFLILSSLIILHLISWDKLLIYFNPMNRLFHDILGCTIFFGGYRLLRLFQQIKLFKVAMLIDRYSFHIYIIHYFLLIGPFTLLKIPYSTSTNIFISLVCITIVTSIFVIICQSLGNAIYANNK